MKAQTALVAWPGDVHLARFHLMKSAQYMCILLMGLVAIRVIRFAPRGILTEVGERRG